MSELAFNITGDAFDVPELVTGWRVKRLKPRGAPELVYGSDGFPLTVPIETDMDGLRQAVGGVLGKYRLDAVDEQGKVVEGVEPAYVTVAKVERTREVEKPAKEDGNSVLCEAMRMNTELAKSVIDRFPEMMHAAAELLRAADGAGMPARQPRQVEDEDDGEEDDDYEPAPTSSPTFELINTLVGQVVPIVVTALAGKKGPSLAGILDWRKAAPQAQPAQLPTETPSGGEAPQPPADEHEELPPLDPKMMGHFIAIQSALTPAEAALARQIAAELSPKEMRAWFAELSALSVPDAVAKIRAFVGGPSKTGGAS